MAGILVAIILAVATTYAMTADSSATSVEERAIQYRSLKLASAAGDETLVRALLEHGAPVEPLDIDAAGALTLDLAESNTPLQDAAEKGYSEVVRLLLTKKQWIDHRCCTAPSALGFAARGGFTDVVRALLAAGADPTVESDFGTPAEDAESHGHVETAKLIKAAIAAREKAQGNRPTASLP